MGNQADELHPVERDVLRTLQLALDQAGATEHFRIDIQTADPADEAPAILGLVPTDGHLPPIRVQVDHECQVTVYFDQEERILELYDRDPAALLTELADVVSSSIGRG
jgi:hypothetical protein